jgi:2-methylcitrate dehydratase PrpD
MRYAEIPARVIALAKAQAASVFASAHAGLGTRASQQILAAARLHGAPGNVPVIATGERFHIDTALTVNAALGMAQDYDDYLFMGHTGHSAVWVAHLLGSALGASGEEILAAQVAANEIGGRMGAACVIGPQNGQLWSHIHLAGTVAAAGRLYKLTPEQMAHAFGIAYAQPVYGLFPGFMGPGAKLLTASTPILIGLHAAQYAKAGLTGNLEIFEDPKGFLRHFAYRAMPRMLSGFGSAWLTETLAVKPYPGCAYIDTTIDAILELRGKIAAARGAFEPSEIQSVKVEASMLTTEMNRLSHEHLDEANLTPININFNIPINAAIAMLAGDLGSRELTEGYLEANQTAIVALSHKVTLEHDWNATLELLNDMDGSLGVQRFFAGFTRDDVRYIRSKLKRDLGHSGFDLQWAELGKVLRSVAVEQRDIAKKLVFGNLRRLWKRGPVSRESLTLQGVDFSRVTLPFQSRVTITLADGAVFSAVHKLPRGSAAKGDLQTVSREKLERELAFTHPGVQVGLAWDALVNFETLGVEAALAAVTAPVAATSAIPE